MWGELYAREKATSKYSATPVIFPGTVSIHLSAK